MSDQKSGSKRVAASTETSDIPPKKRTIQKKTVQKWVSDYEKEYTTSAWLQFETQADDRNHVSLLKCSICARFRDKLISLKNFRDTFIEGTSNIRISTFQRPRRI